MKKPFSTLSCCKIMHCTFKKLYLRPETRINKRDHYKWYFRKRLRGQRSPSRKRDWEENDTEGLAVGWFIIQLHALSLLTLFIPLHTPRHPEGWDYHTYMHSNFQRWKMFYHLQFKEENNSHFQSSPAASSFFFLIKFFATYLPGLNKIFYAINSI